MELSLAGIIGAVIGTMASAAIYAPLVGAIERSLRGDRPDAEHGAYFEQELALLRRGVLALDMLLCAAIGYWIGLKIGG